MQAAARRFSSQSVGLTLEGVEGTFLYRSGERSGIDVDCFGSGEKNCQKRRIFVTYFAGCAIIIVESKETLQRIAADRLPVAAPSGERDSWRSWGNFPCVGNFWRCANSWV
jgi:hypothetical protein